MVITNQEKKGHLTFFLGVLFFVVIVILAALFWTRNVQSVTLVAPPDQAASLLQ